MTAQRNRYAEHRILSPHTRAGMVQFDVLPNTGRIEAPLLTVELSPLEALALAAQLAERVAGMLASDGARWVMVREDSS